MYKAADQSQPTFLDFNQSLGLEMDQKNRWIKMADQIPWEQYEKNMQRYFLAILEM